jgi:signal transduction histidine kinase
LSVRVGDEPVAAQQLRVPGGQESSNALKEPGDLADIVHVVNEVIAAESLTWPGDVALTAPPGPVWCMLPPVPLRRAVCNLLDNATRAAGPAGRVTVEIQQHQDRVLLAVEDNGPGFGKIPNGAGLGWSSVASNVVKYGGRMECSCGVRGGARVSLWLP